MTYPQAASGAGARPAVDGGRLWAGGLATALIAALIVVIGILVARGIFGIPVLAPKGEGAWGDADTAKFAVYAAVAALIATGLLHLLLLFTPRPFVFFGWIVALITIVAMAGPFASNAERSAKFATATINFVLGVAIGSLLVSVGHSAVRSAMLRQRGGPSYPAGGSPYQPM
jgi:Family of unknown function (DUF6069)